MLINLNNTPIAIVGPTGSGKTDFALRLIDKLTEMRKPAVIVNCDAMQQYRGMDIGTAKSSARIRKIIKHYQIDVLDVKEIATVARYVNAASKNIESLLENGIIPIIVGGSMMYYQALIDDWQIPKTDLTIKRKYIQKLTQVGIDTLYQELRIKDPNAVKNIQPNDERRILRALEIIAITGKPIQADKLTTGYSAQHQPKWNTVILGLKSTTENLDKKLAFRTELMFKNGFIEEVSQLKLSGLTENSTAGKAIGYRQILMYLNGNISLLEAKQKTLQSTKRYVRRQLSWFQRDSRINWIDTNAELILSA